MARLRENHRRLARLRFRSRFASKSMSHDLVAWLSTPGAYSPRPARIEHRETHISHVFLAGERVYKLKKPVRFEFVDYSTPSLRRAACEAEVRLNRRTAPGVYEGVVPVVRRGDSWCIGGDGAPVDYLVVMRRLDLDRGLDRLIAGGTLTSHDVARLAARLAELYAERPRLPIDADGYRASYERRVQANADDLIGLPAAEAASLRVHQAQLAQLLLRPERFDARVSAGRIIDGHGDLRPEHIILPTDADAPLQIFDCVEFNAEFRSIDVVDELCFLAAECRRLGAEQVGAAVLDAYYRKSGDRPDPAIVRFYESYRATVRAKVAHLRAAQLQGAEAEPVRAEAARDLQLADDYAREIHQPLCIVVSGASGVGKSTLAAILSRRLRLEWLRTDVIRREFPRDDHDRYSEASRAAVYDELVRRAAALFADRVGVVLDGTFLRAQHIEQAASMARAHGAELHVLRCYCRPEIARNRIAARAARGDDLSEAAPELHARQLAGAKEPPTGVDVTKIDAETSPDQQAEAVWAALRAAGRRNRS